jgi:hypothetical protein
MYMHWLLRRAICPDMIPDSPHGRKHFWSECMLKDGRFKSLEVEAKSKVRVVCRARGGSCYSSQSETCLRLPRRSR